MPVYGFPDKRSYDRMARVVRRAGDLSGGRGAMRYLDPPGQRLRIGKPDTAFTQGILTAPDNVVSLWRGPSKSGDADTGSNLVVHYATVDCATTDYVVCQKINGDWYVTPLTCPE